jgi:hypothetical protein
MKYALRDVKTPGYEKPEGVEGASVCSDSGSVPTDENGCSTRYEYFIKDNVPTERGITKRELFVNKTTHHPPNNESEFADVEPREQTVASDPFIKDYCLDCEPYPEGYQEPPITIPASQ